MVACLEMEIERAMAMGMGKIAGGLIGWLDDCAKAGLNGLARKDWADNYRRSLELACTDKQAPAS